MEFGASWFALAVKPRHEKTAVQHLRLRGLEEFLPLYKARRRWSDRTKVVELALFPGYVFCRFDYSQRWTAVNTPGIASIVGFGKTGTPIPDIEIDSIRAITASGLAVEPCAYLQAGQKILIKTGPLAGIHGAFIREQKACRVIVSIELLNRSVAVDLDRAAVDSYEGTRLLYCQPL
jgi:transcription antitermination factor NusG